MRNVVIVQAQVGSTPLPRKALLRLGSRTVLARVVERLRVCTQVDEVVVATTNQGDDDVIASECRRINVRVVRGSEHDVLARFHHAATITRATNVIRVHADSPLIDPQLIDRFITRYQTRTLNEPRIDYASNTRPRTFPHGLDVEMISMQALAIAYQEATDPHEREHVTPYFYRNPDRFTLDNFTQANDQSAMRWTLEEPTDFVFFQAVFRHFAEHEFVTTEQVLKLLELHPELSRINRCSNHRPLQVA